MVLFGIIYEVLVKYPYGSIEQVISHGAGVQEKDLVRFGE